MKIVVLDGQGVNPGDISWNRIEELGELTVYPRTAPEEVLQHVGDAEIALTNKTVFDANIIAQLKNTKYIGVLATGYNVVDTKVAREYGIVVTNIPAYSTDSVAQMVFAHLLNVSNHVEHYAEETRNGVWSRCPDFCYWNKPLFELAGKTLGIVGLGNIGMKVAQIAQAFGMNVLAYTSKTPDQLPEGIRKTTLDGLFGASDVVSLHCPLTDTTRELMNNTSIEKMRDGAILINTGRGPLVNEADVAAALASGKLGSYCADVLSCEPPSPSNPLVGAPHAFITPHVAWATLEARLRLMDIAVNNIKSFLEGSPTNVVN